MRFRCRFIILRPSCSENRKLPRRKVTQLLAVPTPSRDIKWRRTTFWYILFHLITNTLGYTVVYECSFQKPKPSAKKKSSIDTEQAEVSTEALSEESLSWEKAKLVQFTIAVSQIQSRTWLYNGRLTPTMVLLFWQNQISPEGKAL